MVAFGELGALRPASSGRGGEGEARWSLSGLQGAQQGREGLLSGLLLAAFHRLEVGCDDPCKEDFEYYYSEYYS